MSLSLSLCCCCWVPTSQELRVQAGYVLTDLISLCVNIFLSSRQLSDLVRMFPQSLPGLRVELVVALFSRVVDPPGMHRVLFALSLPERKQLRHRMGWLNLWDPMMPDGRYVLDLSVWEERVVAHALTQLAVSGQSVCLCLCVCLRFCFRRTSLVAPRSCCF